MKIKIKSHENVIISGTYHYMYINTTTGMFTNASKMHPKVIANTSPRGVNAAVKSVSRLLVSSKVQKSPAIYLSIRGDVDLEGVYCDLTMDQSEASMI